MWHMRWDYGRVAVGFCFWSKESTYMPPSLPLLFFILMAPFPFPLLSPLLFSLSNKQKKKKKKKGGKTKYVESLGFHHISCFSRLKGFFVFLLLLLLQEKLRTLLLSHRIRYAPHLSFGLIPVYTDIDEKIRTGFL